MAGIAATLPLCQNDWVLITPCDTPFIPHDTHKIIFSQTKRPLYVASNQDKNQIVFLVNKKLSLTIEQPLKNQDLNLMRWIESQETAAVNFNSDIFFQNFNRPPTVKL